MAEIFVLGHQNPDTDSVVAAMSYAALKNALGEQDYTAARIGSVNDETQHLLNYFGFDAPRHIGNTRNQVCDLDFDHPPALNRSVTIDLAWREMRNGNISTLPIVDEDGHLFGLLSAGDIAAHDMDTLSESRVDNLPVFNLLSVLEGQLVNEYSFVTGNVSGDVRIALPNSFEIPGHYDRDTVLICGNQPEIIDEALAAGISCIIICQTDILPCWSESRAETCIVSTPLDPRQVARLIYQAMPVESICKRDGIVSFHLTDYVDDVRDILLQSRFRCYPLLDSEDRVTGTLSRYHLLKPRRKRIVLVDHNEVSQSVKGLDQAEIIAIVDHHRLADIQTGQPVAVRNEPVGSTNTIIAAMYQENGVMPTPKMAGLMAAAIMSDTVLFKSPTCTKKDMAMAERLSRIAHVSLDEIGKELFASTVSDGKSAEELLKADYKQFHIAEHNLGVSQITCDDSLVLLKRKEEFLEAMTKIRDENSFDMVLLMITDVLLEGTFVLYIGNDDIIRQAFSVEPKERQVYLPKVMSRKKQIIPMLTALWG